MLLSLLIILIVLALIIGLVAGRTLDDHDQASTEAKLRDRARLKAIEGQLAALRSSLRISQAEYITRQRIQEHRDVFANSTIHEEPDEWRNQ